MFSSFQSFRRPTVSKWIISPARYHNRDRLLDVRYGTGRIAMIAFRAQNRAQAHGTFKVLFNALYQAGAVSVPARGSVTRR